MVGKDLKPCPFCGAGAYITTLLSGPFVSCFSCGGETRCYPTEIEAVAAWNTRAGTKAEPENIGKNHAENG